MTNEEMIKNIIHAQDCLNSVWNEARQGMNVGLQVECQMADERLEEVLSILGYYQ
ncbi:hypothetical protein UFOVP250_93 [uncultured Caudovirales phage]|uniref:Uncharacterized protein n=1 Tax=uncultured Caudovirales phage TaxID=2100421 RepID=A0A6J5LJV8_9CAUD|nr:hypothetical protein UFOVP250_93 [uncultured Caudovirales phage]